MEIDIAEWLAADSRTIVRQNVFTAGGVEDGCTPTISDASTNFHVYGIIRTAAPQVQLTVDGVVSCTFTGAKASADAMFLMINIAQASSTSPANTSTIVSWVKECSSACTNGIAGAPATNGVIFDNFTAPTVAYGISIPSVHPRLLWDQTHQTRLNTWWATHSFTPSGSDQFGTMDFLLAYQATGNPAYCTTAISNTTGNASNIAACSTSGNAGCDYWRWWGEVYALTYDWCFSQMSGAQQSTYLTNLQTWAAGNNAQSWGGVGSSQSNYYWGDLRGAILTGIGTYQDSPTNADSILNNAVTTRYANDFTPASTTAGKGNGGVALEGGEYGPYQGYYASTTAFPSVANGGRDIWNETPYWKGTALSRIYMTPPQQTLGTTRPGWDVFPFSDDQNWQNGGPATPSYVGNFMSQAASVWSGINVGKYARQWLSTVSPSIDRIAQAQDTGGSAIAFTSLPTEYYASGPKYLYGRLDWTTSATSFLWQMGDHYSDGHNHDDWGTFQINRKGRWLTRETPGYGETVPGYGGAGTQAVSTGFAHNVPFINGAAGVNIQGGPDNWNSSPVVNRLETQTGYVYADVDLTGVYRNDICCAGHPERGNLAAVHVEREYIFIRDIETFVILDRLQSDTSGRSKTFVFHCETNPTLVDATHVNCINGTQQLSTTTLLPASPSSRSVFSETGAAAGNIQWRIEVNDLPGVTTSYTLHTMQAMDTSGTLLSPSVVDSSPGTPLSGTFTVTIDANHSIVFNKGMTSSGGSITINGSGTGFRSSVQTMTITDAGPVWAGAQTPPPPSPANMFTFVRKETWPTSR